MRAYNVSPKLATSGNLGRPRLAREALCALRDTGRASWKFVVTGPDDFSEIDALVSDLGLGPVYIMPEGTEAEVLKARLIELAPCARRGAITSPAPARPPLRQPSRRMTHPSPSQSRGFSQSTSAASREPGSKRTS